MLFTIVLNGYHIVGRMHFQSQQKADNFCKYFAHKVFGPGNYSAWNNSRWATTHLNKIPSRHNLGTESSNTTKFHLIQIAMYYYRLHIDDSKKRVINLGCTKYLEMEKAIVEAKKIDSTCSFYLDGNECYTRRINGIFENKNAYIDFSYLKELWSTLHPFKERVSFMTSAFNVPWKIFLTLSSSELGSKRSII